MNNFGSPFGYNSLPTATQPYGYPMNPYTNFGGTPAPTQPAQTAPVVNTNKIYVNGIEDVRNRPLPPNSDGIFLDNDKPLLYQKVVDSKGQFDVKTFDIIPHVEQPKPEISKDFVPRSEFEALQKKFSTLEDTVAMLIPTKSEEVKVNGTTNSINS